MTPPTLTTDRLIIEPLSLEHWEDYAAAWADPRTTEFIGGKPRSRNESWMRFGQAAGLWALVGYGYWAFVDRGDGSYVGVGGLAQMERGLPGLEGFPEAGWAIAPQRWGQGLATEAVAAMLAWADDVLEEPEIRCLIADGNGASIRVAEKLGFSYLYPCEQAFAGHSYYGRRAVDGPASSGGKKPAAGWLDQK